MKELISWGRACFTLLLVLGVVVLVSYNEVVGQIFSYLLLGIMAGTTIWLVKDILDYLFGDKQ